MLHSAVGFRLDHRRDQRHELRRGEKILYAVQQPGDDRLDYRTAGSSIFDALYFIQRMEADKLSKAELESGKRVIQKAIFNLQLCEGPTHGLDARYTRFLKQTN